MTEARQEHEESQQKCDWGRTSSLMALIFDMFRDPKKTKAVKPSDFNPTFSKKNRPKIQGTLQDLKDFFIPKDK
jgi:hypothetical protein